MIKVTGKMYFLFLYFKGLCYEILTFPFLYFCSSAARGVVILFPTLGLSWGFSVIAFNHDALVWKYLFVTFTSLQVIIRPYFYY